VLCIGPDLVPLPNFSLSPVLRLASWSAAQRRLSIRFIPQTLLDRRHYATDGHRPRIRERGGVHE
jgi:hypothetical protein